MYAQQLLCSGWRKRPTDRGSVSVQSALLLNDEIKQANRFQRSQWKPVLKSIIDAFQVVTISMKRKDHAFGLPDCYL